MDDLAARLAHRAEGSQLNIGRRLAELFRELSPGDALARLARFDFALRDRPRAVVPALPEWAARMDEQDLRRTVNESIKQQAGGFLAQRCLRVSQSRGRPASR